MSRLAAALLVSAVAALLVLPPLGQRILASNDEARYALLARDMLDRGVWFDVQVRGTPYRNKPLLYPWSIAALARLGGRVTESAAQAPVAAATIGSVLFTFLLGDRLFGRRVGLWAGLILATSYGVFGLSRLSLTDPIVVCFGTLAGWSAWRAIAEPPWRGAWLAFYAALALGVFAKGPVGLLPLLPVALWLSVEHGAGGIRRLWSPAGAALFALITLIWLVPLLALGSAEFGQSVVWGNWLAWYLGLPAPRSLGNLAVDFLAGLLPWTFVAPLAAAAAVGARRDPAVRFALLWAAVPLLLIMLAHNQRTRYLAPVYPGAALLVAWWADARGTGRTTAARVLAWLALGGAAAVVAALTAPTWIGMAELAVVPASFRQALPLIAGALLLGFALFRGLCAGRPALLVYGSVAAMVILLGYGARVQTPRFNALWDFPRLAAVIERRADGAEVGAFPGRWLSIDFYLGRPLRSLRTAEEFSAYVARAERPVVVVNDRTWGYLRGQIPPRIQVLERMRIGGQELLLVRDGGPGPGRDPR